MSVANENNVVLGEKKRKCEQELDGKSNNDKDELSVESKSSKKVKNVSEDE